MKPIRALAIFKLTPIGKAVSVVVSLMAFFATLATFVSDATGPLGRIIPDVLREPQSLSADERSMLIAELRRAFVKGDLTETDLAHLSQDLSERHSLHSKAVDRVLAEWLPAIRLAGESLSRGFQLIGKGRVDQAQQEFLSASRSDPGDPKAWSNLGACYALKAQHGDAREAYDRALALDPGDSATRYNFGLLLARMGSARESMPQLLQALSEMRRRPAQRTLLRQAVEELKSPEFAVLRAQPEFSELVGGV